MIVIIDNKEELGSFVSRVRSRSIGLDGDLLNRVASIIQEVRERGDAALIDYGKQFDSIELTRSELRFGSSELERCAANVDQSVLEAIRVAISNVREFHIRQVEESWEFAPAEGIRLGQRISPIDRVGLYVPGGTAAYPSSVIMNVVPAQVAGVERILVATPPRALQENPAVAAALVELNVTEVYSIGGAQAIAALAFGTETVPNVDKITGPGNKYVAAAKKLVFGFVGIDSIAGPSEVVIVADETAQPDYLAADLLAQSEHGEDASAILITTSETLAQSVKDALVMLVKTLPRSQIATQSLAQYGAVIIVRTIDDACEIVNDLAPEHVEVVTANVESVSDKIRNAGAIFLGPFTPEAVGDYLAGPNHILPTQRNARFASALGVYDFVKRTSILSYSRAALASATRSIGLLADTEGLNAHALSVRIRSGENDQ